MNIREKLHERQNRLIVCLIKILVWLIKESPILDAMLSCLQIKKTMDQCKSSAVFDPFNSVPLTPLDGLPPAIPIFKSFTSENVSFSEFKETFNS